MNSLERIWEIIGFVVSGTLSKFERSLTSLFGSSNARLIKRLYGRVERIAALESKYESMSEEELRGQTELFRQRLRDGETLDDILEEAFAVCREGGKRFLGMRHYDVQLIGGMVLHGGNIAEMVTGEGKTLVATLPAYLNALAGKGVHVITVNDYLARRDMEWMAPLYMGLGLSVGTIQSGMSTKDRQEAYAKEITYGTNNEFGFDYLRDNMRPAARGDERFPKELQQSQGPLNYCIIDEVDNILIDEARTPLIISGPANTNPAKYAEADRVARQLKKDVHFEVNEKDHTVNLTDDGVREAEKLAGVESFYTAGNMEWPHLIDNALKAHYLYHLDVNYVVKDRTIVIVDEFTGRLMEGRQWSDGLHQAVEVKENVPIKDETQTLATITLQNFFKLYDKISGMTGTAMTEATEFYKIYGLDVVAIPTNREMQRIEHSDVIYLTEKDKFRAIAEDIERATKWDVLVLKNDDEIWGKIEAEDDESVTIVPKESKAKEQVPRSKIARVECSGRPVLVGTVSIEKSERLGALLERRGIKHEVLNAKQHKREADIVAQAGRIGAVTIATNMAGRGTDIILGGNPETMAWAKLQDRYPTRLEVPKEEWDDLVSEIETRENMKAEGQRVRELGGLYVIGTERHESRRIDLQLRGRCGRQGDPGGSRFFLSLEDDLMRVFAGDFVKSVMERLGMKEGEAIESSMVSRRIAAAQKKVEERNFEIRKNLLEYDEVMDEQRKRVYSYRQRILDGISSRQLVLDLIRGQIEHYVGLFLEPDYGVDSFAAWAGGKLSCQLEARDFRNMDFESADQFAKDQAERAAESAIFEAIEENLPSDLDESEWNWQALATWSNTRYGTNFRPTDLKKIGRDDLDEVLVARAQESIAKVDLKEGAVFLDEDFGLKSLIGWMRNKFNIDVPIAELQEKEKPQIERELIRLAEESYEQKETEYPVLAGLSTYAQYDGKQLHVDREGMARWASNRFSTELSPDDLHGSSEEIRNLLISHSARDAAGATSTLQTARQKVDAVFADVEGDPTAAIASGGNGSLDSLVQWVGTELNHNADPGEYGQLDRERLQQIVDTAVDDRYHPEMRRMERQVLLSIVDSAWKDHLLAMDHLRSSVGLKGYAQMDPKVEYKREGMRLFENMWKGIGERCTDLIFRMESLNADFVRSTHIETSERHDDAQSATQMAESEHQRAAQQSSNRGGEEEKMEPIRNRVPRVGRNAPCPCGSGKKYKQCHGRRA